MNPETTTAQFQTDSPRCVAQSPAAKAESDCLDTARELHGVLQEEADILRRFAKNDLLELIPRKEFLINELWQKLEWFKSVNGQIVSVSGPLRDQLLGIDRLNRSNRVFIERSLAHWQDFLSIFIPSGYRPNGGNPGGRQNVPRGFAFSREV